MKIAIFILVLILGLPYIFKFGKMYLKNRQVKKKELKENTYIPFSDGEEVEIKIICKSIKITEPKK
jgi:hypothetical protein